MDILKEIEKIVKENPNDMDLGKKIRVLYTKFKEKKDGISQKKIKKI